MVGRHAGHCCRSRDKLISDVLLWTPSYGRAKAGRPAWTYIQQLCEDTGCSPEDLSEAMNDREKWRERVRYIRAGDTTWWSQLLSLIKISSKLKVDLYCRGVKQQNSTTNNRYTQFTINPTNCHRDFQVKFIFSELIS